MEVLRQPSELPGIRPGAPRAVVMTMGALHEGHASLFRAARQRVGDHGVVIATIFVNPLQFGSGEDFARYPRDFETDLALCQAEGVDVVFNPEASAIYPPGAAITVEPGPLGDVLEGAHRPTHFRGVLTVVAKFLNITRADFAPFGEKDYQQLTLIRSMVRELFMPVEIIPVATVREKDGLAMSSRNRYLAEDERARATAISRSMESAAAACVDGAAAGERAGVEVLHEAGITSIDYFTVRSNELGEPAAGSPGRILVAAHVGETRLLDNLPCVVGHS